MFIDFADFTTIKTISVNDELLNSENEVFSKFRVCVERIKLAYRYGAICPVSCSMGKDSLTLLVANLTAYEECRHEGSIDNNVPFIVTHIDTLIENAPMFLFSRWAIKKLKSYAKMKNINLDLRIESPPLHQQFVMLFTGARKLFSTPMTSSDCSVIWKVDLAKKINRNLLKTYNKDLLISLNGSRSSESQRREANILKYGQKQSIEDLIATNSSGVKTIAPLHDLTTDEIFQLLERFGTNPKTSLQNRNNTVDTFLESFASILSIYNQSDASVCEISLDHTGNEKGCGKNANNRMGCSLCLMSDDKSGKAQNELIRWSSLQGGMSKLRDYCASVANNANYRSCHPRAVDTVTNYIALQPNVLKPAISYKIVHLAAQITRDDQIRANNFKRLVEAGVPELDLGYKDILDDVSLDEISKSELLEMYKEEAVNPLYKLFTIEHAVMLSGIWSLDGVRLPNYTPVKIWENVNKGNYLPWPNIKTNKENSSIGEALFVKVSDDPEVDLASLWRLPFYSWDMLGGDFEPKSCSGMYKEIPKNTQDIKVHYDGEILKVKDFRTSKSLELGMNTLNELREVAQNKLNITDEPHIEFVQSLSFRKPLKITDRALGRLKSVKPIVNFTKRKCSWDRATNSYTKTRQSLLFYKRNEKSSLESSRFREIMHWEPDLARSIEPIISINCEDDISLKIDGNALNRFIQNGKINASIQIYDKQVALSRKMRVMRDNKFSVRNYGDTEPFFELLSLGVIKLTNSQKKNCLSVRKRTELFNQLGLLNLGDKLDNSNHRLISQSDYRSDKAKILLNIRNKRTQSRLFARNALSLEGAAKTQLVTENFIDRINTIHKLRMNYIGSLIQTTMLVSFGAVSFDHINNKNTSDVLADWFEEIATTLHSLDNASKFLLSQEERKLLSVFDRSLIIDHLFMINSQFMKKVTSEQEIWLQVLNKSEVIRNGIPSVVHLSEYLSNQYITELDNIDNSLYFSRWCFELSIGVVYDLFKQDYKVQNIETLTLKRVKSVEKLQEIVASLLCPSSTDLIKEDLNKLSMLEMNLIMMNLDADVIVSTNNSITNPLTPHALDKLPTSIAPKIKTQKPKAKKNECSIENMMLLMKYNA
ncbi:hypothetical protein EIJ81_00675 (plasmid) [Aliivibrio salmonicida]|uniref:hypothetical protein n=1 Tax=Aliivibrio salmonicida TaxID=40269 RepID=UPI000F6D65DD|nr:hypothetical protein [Aliivibrio salmonicida]AZL83413.1 hypothetical protein EIJ81_00675 [Aliivibrio salmonicida]